VTAVEEEADTAVLLRGQTEVLERIADGAPLADVLAQVVTTLEVLLPECLCSVLLLDAESQTLRHGAAPSLPGAYSARIDGMRIGARAGSCGTAAYLGTPVVVADIGTDPLWDAYRDLAGRYDLRACWSTPIRGRDGVLGTFAVYHRRPHQPSEREHRLVDRLTHLASVAIDHDRLFGALAESEEAFRRAFDDNVVGMALTGLDRVLTRANPALRELLGRPADDLVGADLDAVCPRARPAGGPRRRAEQYEATARHTGGDRLDLVVTVSPVRDADGVPVRLSVAVLDVTGRRAAERDRRARREAELARTAAEAASRAKSDFVAALGHELRTPLQAITGFAELLGGLDLPPERRTAAIGHIQAAAAHILSMVDDVLDVARIEAGALPLQAAPEDLGAVVAEVVALLEPLARAHRVVLRTGTGPGGTVCVDRRRLTQVLLNVIGNAVRYNHPGGEVAVALSGNGPDEALVTVHDTGPGIPAEHLDRLFTPFDRLGVDGDEGVGLGLPLARGIATAMGGRLEVRSTVGVGTTIVVAVRRAPAVPDPH
jgi:PAS domain S-box-containing protein